MDNQDFYHFSNMPEPPTPPSFGGHYYTNAPQRNFDPKKLILFIVGGVVVLAALIYGIVMFSAKKNQCAVDGCTNIKLDGFAYCSAHKCKETDCSHQKMDGKDYCQAHQEIKDREEEERQAEERKQNEIWGEALDCIQGDWEIVSTVGSIDNGKGWLSVDGSISIKDKTYSTTLILRTSSFRYKGNLSFGEIAGAEDNQIYVFSCTDISSDGALNMISIMYANSFETAVNNTAEYDINCYKYIFIAIGEDMKNSLTFVARQRKRPENHTVNNATKNTPLPTTSTKTGYATDALNVRRDASTDHDRVGLLKKGAAVTIVGEENGFYKIKYSWKQNGSSGQYAYVSKDYITLKKPSSSSSGSGNSNSGGNSGNANSNNGGGSNNEYFYDDNTGGGGNSNSGSANSNNGGGNDAPEATTYQGKTVTGQISLPAVTDSSKLEMVFGYANAKRKDTVYIPVNLTNNPGFWGMVLDLSYDTNVLELVDWQLREPFASQLNQTGKAFDAKDLADVTAKGQIFWLVFRVKENAPSGNTYINASTNDCIDADGNDIRAIFHNGCIIVS